MVRQAHHERVTVPLILSASKEMSGTNHKAKMLLPGAEAADFIPPVAWQVLAPRLKNGARAGQRSLLIAFGHQLA